MAKTFAEIRETLAEVAKAQTRNEREIRESRKEAAERLKEAEARLKIAEAGLAAAEKSLQETQARLRAEEKRAAAVRREWGDFTDGEGEMAEDEFAAALRAQNKIGKHRLKGVLQRLKNIHEYDLVCLNGRAVFVGEVKRSLTVRDVRAFADESLPRFAEEFPGHARGRKIYGMVGGMRINPAAEREAKTHHLILLRLKNRAVFAEHVGEARPMPRSRMSPPAREE